MASANHTTPALRAAPPHERRKDAGDAVPGVAGPRHAERGHATPPREKRGELRSPLAAIAGNAWCFGDHVNTDVIHPPEFFSLDPERVKKGLFHGFDPELQKRFRPSDVVVAGRNFGCGSSRETSIRSLKLNRVGAVVAIDFARIFFRNATNNGIPCLTFENPFDATHVWPGERVRICFETWTLTTESADRIELTPAPDFILSIWQAGGLLETLALN